MAKALVWLLIGYFVVPEIGQYAHVWMDRRRGI